ncbi:ImmA/IrrE family metallo-endopeptidase [Streptococcus dysgalactiae subsp. dysgalactiae]|nr:ImmA/IrrE family metallo-endopeptidase [Streptococcus dysgalactiae subsp. dysgalactiae]
MKSSERLTNMTSYQYSITTAKQLIYKYMKLNDIKSKYYSYHSFFDYYVKELNILVMEHNLDTNFSGLSVIDKDNRSSISYHKNHCITRQNFTKCHELGHFLLDHEGTIFTENNENTIQEHEANCFASFVLAPDIVLLYKIVYENQSFKSILNDLEISKDCLEIRLFHLLKDYTNLNNKKIENLIIQFQQNKNRDINLFLYDIKDSIIFEYQNINPSNFDKSLHLLSKIHYVSSIEIEELVTIELQNKLKLYNSNLNITSYFDFGKTVFYVWDTRYLDSNQVLKKVKAELFNYHFFKTKIS